MRCILFTLLKKCNILCINNQTGQSAGGGGGGGGGRLLRCFHTYIGLDHFWGGFGVQNVYLGMPDAGSKPTYEEKMSPAGTHC